MSSQQVTKKPRRIIAESIPHHSDDPNIYEIGVDEVGRGPLFGRVYAAACVIPRNKPEFKYGLLKDSKRFTSEKKIGEVNDHICTHALEYSIAYEESTVIDSVNIRKATFKCMDRSIRSVFQKLVSSGVDPINIVVLVDGSDFRPFTYFDQSKGIMCEVAHECIVGGDNIIGSISAASIIAKVARDTYIHELCEQFPKLDEYYNLGKNKGYGTAAHINGINQFGITKWHRKSYGSVASNPTCDVGI